VLRTRDLLVHHPYESFSSSTEEFIEQAATDPRVQGIKITLYRTSPDSAIARSLIKAAEMGKQVVALIELTARFDEATNVGWAKELERAGVHVVYGVVGLKTHSKCVLVVRQEESGLRRYVHVGTGNYNSKTAKTYEDIGLFSCNEAICDDVSRLFNALTGFSNEPEYSCLIVAPKFLRPRFLELIENEIAHGENGHILMKMNALADKEIVEILYRAAEAGVKIDLIVRGACTLPAQVVGLTENIRVRSVIGRFLEHSRVFYFRQGEVEDLYLSSADWMNRNMVRRVELAWPVTDPVQRQRIVDECLVAYLHDAVDAWDLGPDGTYTHCKGGKTAHGAQAALMKRYARNDKVQRGA
jgi:polyphosphate kinase